MAAPLRVPKKSTVTPGRSSEGGICAAKAGSACGGIGIGNSILMRVLAVSLTGCSPGFDCEVFRCCAAAPGVGSSLAGDTRKTNAMSAFQRASGAYQTGDV